MSDRWLFRLLLLSSVYAGAACSLHGEDQVRIEVLQDIEVGEEAREFEPNQSDRHSGIYSTSAFTLHRGDTIQMIEKLYEGRCLIRNRGRMYELSSCPWLEGFTDSRAKEFRVIDSR